jgi:polysaccharide pyruvyl transferase WcaK-like protein
MIHGNKLIEIRKTDFVNKGSELMLYAIIEKMKKEFPDAKFAMVPKTSSSTPYEKRALLGFYQKVHFWRKGMQFGVFANFIPKQIREMYGLVLDKELDIVIDSSGFSYSDHCGKYNCLELANSCKRWKKNGAKIILMPQAFGPFDNFYNRKALKDVFRNADLVFARDKISYDYLVEVVGKRSNLRMAPDFTNLVKGIIPDKFNRGANRFCIIPNYRMVDKTNMEDSEAYLPFIIEVTRYAYEKGQMPFILVHESRNDLRLAEKIRDSVSEDIQIIEESHPLKIKGILGEASGVFGSRFHGLVSALSQGTPALAIGWSHKYQMLFQDYGVPEGLLNVQMQKEDLHKAMDSLIDEVNKNKLINTIKHNGDHLKRQSQQMWDDVLAVLKS